MVHSARWGPVAATLAAAAVLAGSAVVTADRAGCDEPGRWIVTAGSVELVGGCLDSADLPVAPPPTRPGPERSVPLGD